ncbi:MAG: flagellar basal body-associated FliL family protein [candidate division Zixibacteria bacterium]|nr:flagellar basal body-associated FliL family protein [candidate division Zixibacteria bacterium]
MAADNDKTQIQSAETAEPKPAAKKSNKLLLFGGIGVGLLVIGVALAVFVLKPMLAGGEEAKAGSAKKTEKSDTKSGHGDKKSESKPKSDHGKASDAIVYSIKDIVVNPAGTAGSRFLSVSFGFELESPGLATEFEAREPIVRDVLITILSSKTLADLTDAKHKEVMRVQIKKRLSQVLNTEELAGVYYTDFVLQ